MACVVDEEGWFLVAGMVSVVRTLQRPTTLPTPSNGRTGKGNRATLSCPWLVRPPDLD